jgi:hypothetical protein
MNFELPREKKIDETAEFKTFSKEIDYLINFFRSFSELMFYNGRIITFISSNNYFTLNSTLVDSSIQTFQSIKLCCSIGSFSDANTLIRKLRDDLIQYVYILNIINLQMPFNNNLTDDEKAVSAWFSNTVHNLPPGPIKKKLEFKNYMNVLKQNQNIEQILNEYNLKEYWEILRKKLNDYVHNNGAQFSNQNFIKAHDKYLQVHLNNINTRTSFISSFFIVALLMIDSSLISSTDYIDYLDCGLKPLENSQYFIANFIQDFIDTKVVKLHPELKQYLIDNNINGMKIE